MDVGCQVKICSTESSSSKLTDNVGTQTEISFALSSQSTLPEQVNTAAVYETCEFSPQKLHDFCVNFTNNKQDTRNAEHGKDEDAHKTIRKVEHSKDDGENETCERDRTVSGMHMRSENTSGLLPFLPVYKKTL